MLRSISWIAVALLACVGAQAATVSHTGWFGFYLPWDDTSRNATDQSWSVEAPAGRHGILGIGKDGHFRFADGTRVRFSGYSTVAQANLPDSADAPLIAAHLRRLGTNFLRLHLTDVDGIYGVFANSTRETRTLDVAKMRKIDWFMKCLRDNGIYYNLCVQAGRIFKDGDGIPAPVTNTQSKYVTLFDPSLISLEKELARTLAEHVNAYTGIAYKNDPALATWEITNENQLFLGWLSWGSPNWDSATATNPEGMNGYYVRELDALWNRWLQARYGRDSVLSASWTSTGGLGENLVQEPSFETGTKGWGWWADPSDGAGITVVRTRNGRSGDYALSVRIDSQGTAAYKASVDYTGMSVAKGRNYRLRIWLKGSEPTTVRAEFLKESVWDWYGAQDCAVDTAWGLCEASFTAPADISDSLRFNIDVGLSKGTVLLDSADFRECSGDGLRTGESLEAATVRRSSKSTIGLLSPARAADEAKFYYDMEGSYIAALKGYLKDSLGVAVPVTFTNNWYGLASLASQARGDYTEANWYWQHPSFPNGWSNTDYSIGNTPMVKDADGGRAAELTWSRVVGKPFMGTEYDHPFPSHFLCEAPALYFGHMGFLDADGALMFAYVDYEKERYKTTWTEQFFNNGTNPVFLTQSPLWRLFQTGAISPARSEAIVNVAQDEWAASARAYGAGWPRGANPRAFLARPMRWGRFDATASDSLLLADPGTHSVSSTGELDWDRTAGIFKVDNPRWQGAVGYLRGGASTSMLALEGIATTGGRDFAAIHLVSADSLSLARTRRMLLLTSARIENRSQVWNSTFTALTTIYKAGDTTVCEPVTGTVKLSLGRDDSVSVYRLDARGNRMEALPVAFEDGRAVIVLPGTSLWYEVALGDATSAISRISFPSASGNSLRLRSGFGARLAWTSEKGGILEVRQYDVHGRLLWHFRRTVPAGSGEIALPRSGFCVVRTKLIAGAALERTFAATSW